MNLRKKFCVFANTTMVLAPVGLLMALYGSDSPKRQLDHITALGRSGKLTAVPELYRTMTGSNNELRIPAATAIQRICRVVIGDTPELASSNTSVFISAKVDHTKIPVNLRRFLNVDPALIVLYEGSSRSPDPNYAQKLIEVLARRGFSADYEDVSEKWQWKCGSYGNVQVMFWETCRKNPNVVLELLQSPSFAFKGALIGAIGKYSQPFEETLVKLTQANLSSIRARAIYALSGHHGAQINEAFVRAATDMRAVVRRAVVETVRFTAPRLAVRILVSLSKDPNPTVAQEAKSTLATIDELSPPGFPYGGQ